MGNDCMHQFRELRLVPRCLENRNLAMSEPFRPYEKLVDITILRKKFQVPERNSSR